MAMTLKIKRKSSGTGAPGSLEYGELAVDTAGSIWVGNSGGSPVSVGGGGGNLATALGSYEFVEEKTYSGGGTTSLDFDTTLNGDSDYGYRIEVHMKAAIVTSLNLRINGADASGQTQILYGYGTSIGAIRYSSSIIYLSGYIGASGYAHCVMDVPNSVSNSGLRSVLGHTQDDDGTGNVRDFHLSGNISTPSISTNITSLGIATTGYTNAIDAGTWMRLYKLKKPNSSTSITASSTATVDSTSTSTVRTAKWVISIKDATAGTYAASEIVATHDGSTVYWTEYAKIGSFTSYTPDVDISSGLLRLRITNSGANTIAVKAHRTEVPV